MNMENTIEKLFYDYQQSEEYVKAYKTMPRLNDISVARDTIVAPEFKKSFEAGDKIECVFTGALGAVESFGFVQGFKYAMRLRAECMR